MTLTYVNFIAGGWRFFVLGVFLWLIFTVTVRAVWARWPEWQKWYVGLSWVQKWGMFLLRRGCKLLVNNGVNIEHRIVGDRIWISPPVEAFHYNPNGQGD